MPEHGEYVVIMDAGGTATSFLMRPGSTIRRDPASGQTQTTTIGEGDRRGDTRTPEVIWTDQGLGMGTFEYEEINGVNSFTDSNCDTRYQGLICLPPATTSLGSLGITTSMYEIEQPNVANAVLLAWAPLSGGANPVRWTSGTTWTSIATIASIYGYCKFKGFLIFATDTANGLWYSTNGSAWTNLAYAKHMHGCCTHDNKLYIWNSTDSRIEWTTDPTAAFTSVSAQALYLKNSEVVYQLIEWQRGGRAMIFIITSQRVLWYDEDADQYIFFDDFTSLVSDSAFPHARTRRSDGNLYLVLGDTTVNEVADTIIWYSGNTNLASPNMRGGMLTASRLTFQSLCDSFYYMFFWGKERFGTSNLGRVLALNSQGGWHTMLVGTSTSARVAGGTFMGGQLYTVLSNGAAFAQSVQDARELPLFATGRTYPTSGTFQHELAFTDGGTENMLKQALWVTVGARDMNLTYKGSGTPANTTIQVEYLRNSDTAWTSIGTLTHASTFPAVLSINSGFGIKFRQIKFRLTLASTDANSTPIVTSFALAYLRAETIRDAYTLELDLRDMTHPIYRGQDRAQLLAKLNAYRAPGALVSLAFAGGDYDAGTQPAGYRKIANAAFSYGGIDYPSSGPGVYQCQFIDLTPPGSGDTP